MKLRYYLRGLGIGMAVTALILGISTSQNTDRNGMTDAQIKERAAQLGMVDADSVTLGALQAAAEDAAASTQASEPQTVEDTVPVEPTAETVTTETLQETQETQTPEPQETETPEPEQTQVPQETEAAETTTTAQESGAQTPAETVTITIRRGDSSNSVSTRLKEAGLIENASAFDTYLCKNGYDRSISIGTYEIPAGTSEEEIAEIITGKR